MEKYREEALPLSVKAIESCLQSQNAIEKSEITHLVLVSCTGMYAPGLDIDIIETLGLKNTVERTCITFMGCYAAINGIKTADYIARAEAGAVVLVVCVELCTIHFQKSMERDHLVSNSLFGDGAAGLLITSEKPPGISFAINSFHCAIAGDGKNDMAWNIGDQGFEMTLSSYVPKFIKGGIKELTSSLLKKANINLGNIDFFAIHPGGRRILEVCQEELGITAEDNRFSFEVLREYGNMSSATVLFVVNQILNQLTVKDDRKRILCVAFGPGLTMESALLSVNYV